MTEILFVVEEDPEGGYRARAVGESIVTQADDMSQLREMVRDAVRCHFPDVSSRPTHYESRGAAPDTQPSTGEEESEKIRQVFCALGDLDRLIIWAYVVEGRPVRAIARELDLSWHSVARTIERTLRRVHSELGESAV